MDKNNSFEFFEDEEDNTRIDLIEIQKSIFQRIFDLTHSENHNDDEETDVEVGDGQKLDKRILAFKVLVYDQ